MPVWAAPFGSRPSTLTSPSEGPAVRAVFEHPVQPDRRILSVRKLVFAWNGVTIVATVCCAHGVCPPDSLIAPSWSVSITSFCSSGAATNKVHSSRSGCGNVMLSKVRSANWHALAAYAAAVRWPAENGAARTVASLKWNCKIFLSTLPATLNDGCGDQS